MSVCIRASGKGLPANFTFIDLYMGLCTVFQCWTILLYLMNTGVSQAGSGQAMPTIGNIVLFSISEIVKINTLLSNSHIYSNLNNYPASPTKDFMYNIYF